MYASSAKNEKGDQEEDALEDRIKQMTFSGEFTNNLLVIGQTGSGKTIYVENLLECGFVKGNELIWVSSEALTSFKRDSYHKRFKKFDHFAFFQVRDKKEMTALLNDMECDIRKNHEDTNRQTVIVFDDHLNIADKCEAYSSFLSTCRHIGVRTINMFQGFRNCDKWDSIKANCQTVSLFKLGWLTHRLICQITNVAIRGGNRVVPKRSGWLYKLYQELVMGKGDFTHLMVDLRSESENNLTCFRSQTDNPRVQVCYFDAGNQTDYQIFHAARVTNLNKGNNEHDQEEEGECNIDDSMKFKIVSIIQSRRLNSKYKLRKSEPSRKRNYSDIDSDADSSEYAENSESWQNSTSHRSKRTKTYDGEHRRVPQPRLSNGRYASPMYLSSSSSHKRRRPTYDVYSSSSYVSSDSDNDNHGSSYNDQAHGRRPSGQQTHRRNVRRDRPEYTNFVNDRYTPAYV